MHRSDHEQAERRADVRNGTISSRAMGGCCEKSVRPGRRPPSEGAAGAIIARMSNDDLQPSEDEITDQVMADAEGGVESSTLDAPDDDTAPAEHE
jgi:hypothetical protein